MDGTNNQSGSQKLVLNLDAIGQSVVASTLSLAKSNADEVIKSSLRQITETKLIVDTFLEPIRQALEAFREFIQKVLQPVWEAISELTRPLSFLLTSQPIYLVQPRSVSPDRQLDRYLSIEVDSYGFFIIAGKKWSILHPSSSRCGKLLAFLLERRSQVVDYDTLRSVVGAGNLEKDFKDLKYQLKRRGIKLDYARPRSYGIALNGLQVLQ